MTAAGKFPARYVRISLLLAVSFLLSAQPGAKATVFMHPPQPDLRLSFAVATTELVDLQTVLLRFGASENFTAYRNVPRASGKLFFLGLQRDDSILIIAEKSSGALPVIVECVNVNGSAPDFAKVEAKFITALRERWPHLDINRKDPTDND